MALNGIRFYSASPREIPMIGVLIKLTRSGARKKFGSPILGCAARRLSAAEREIRGDSSDETMTMIGRGSKRRSRRRALRRRKLVSCFVAKVKTVTLLSASLTSPCASEQTRALAKPSFKHRRGWPPLARPQLHPIKHD